MFSLIGGGMKKLPQSVKSMKSVLPTGATWLKDQVNHFDPVNGFVLTQNGNKISYDVLVVAVGLELRYDKVGTLISQHMNDIYYIFISYAKDSRTSKGIGYAEW